MPPYKRPKKPTLHVRTSWTREFLRITQRTDNVWFSWRDVLEATKTLPPAAIALLRNTVWMTRRGLGRGASEVFVALHGELLSSYGSSFPVGPELKVRPANLYEMAPDLKRRTQLLLGEYEHVSEWGQFEDPDGFAPSSEIISTANGYRNTLQVQNGDDDWRFCMVLAGGHLIESTEINGGVYPAPFSPVTGPKGETAGEALSLQVDYSRDFDEDHLLRSDSAPVCVPSEIFEHIWVHGVLPGQVLLHIAGWIAEPQLVGDAWR